jgi:hypothetical protein
MTARGLPQPAASPAYGGGRATTDAAQVTCTRHPIREHLHHWISRRLLGRSTGPESRPRQHASAASPAAPGELTDEQALERYRYLVRTAPPEAIEQAHEEAFAKLTPEQRRMALRDLSAAVPEDERPGGDDPAPSPG